MKKLFFLGIFTTGISLSLQATNIYKYQKYPICYFPMPLVQHQDTLKFLETNIINSKSKFQHQQLNLLLKELKLDVKSYSINLIRKPNGNLSCLVLIFDDIKTQNFKESKHLEVPFLNIYFEEQVTQNQAMGMYAKTMGEWTQTEKDFYGKLLVKDIIEMQPHKSKK